MSQRRASASPGTQGAGAPLQIRSAAAPAALHHDHTQDDEASAGGPVWEPAPIRQLNRFGDYVLFRGTIGQVVAEGRFDANWKVPAAAATQLTAAGTVKIR